MRTVQILSMRIDVHGRLLVRPEITAKKGGYSGYDFIYRDASWVRWDAETSELFVMLEKIENLEEQFTRISGAVLSEYGDKLEPNLETDYSNVSAEVVSQLFRDSTK